MVKKQDDQRRMFRYLLGEMGEEERRGLEESYFIDDNLFEELLAAEDRLIDSYLRGGLSKSEREKFENHFMVSAARRERVEDARSTLESQGVTANSASPALSRQSRRSRLDLRSVFKATHNRAFRSWALVAVIAVALGALWLATRYVTRSPDSIPQRVLSFELISTALRGSAALQVLDLPPETKQVKLQLYSDTWDYKTYHAELQTSAGVEIWREDALTARSWASMKLITVTVPSEMLPTGTYSLTLFGNTRTNNSDALGEYQFKVMQR